MIHTDDPGPVSRQKRRILNPFRALSVSPHLPFHLSHLRFCVSILLLLAFSLTSLSCRKEAPPEPPPYVRSIHLTAEDASCTEAWLRIKLERGAVGGERGVWRLVRDGQTVLSVPSSPLDTLVVDEGLLPNRSYSYKAYRLTPPASGGAGEPTDSSSLVTVRTMDTTSHNFTWQIDTLGDGASSVLYDVAIINDTLAYAVGEIYLRDSTGGIDPTRYNLAVWNGTRWSIRRLAYYFQGQPFYHPIQTVFAFNASDIWFAGNGVSRWDGQRFIEMPIPSSVWGPNRMNKIWGSSSSDIYIVGDNGSIAHYANGTWRRIESGTRADIQDIWGAIDLHDRQLRVIAAASNRYTTSEKKLLSISANGGVDTLSWSPQSRLHSMWFRSPDKIFVGGSGVYVGRPGTWLRIGELGTYFSTRVRGSERNNVVVVGAYGLCAHYNGLGWRSYPEVFLSDGILESLALTSEMIVAVGQVGNRAVVLRGYSP